MNRKALLLILFCFAVEAGGRGRILPKFGEPGYVEGQDEEAEVEQIDNPQIKEVRDQVEEHPEDRQNPDLMNVDAGHIQVIDPLSKDPIQKDGQGEQINTANMQPEEMRPVETHENQAIKVEDQPKESQPIEKFKEALGEKIKSQIAKSDPPVRNIQPPKCQASILHAFNMGAARPASDPKLQEYEPPRSNAKDRAFCRRNKFTCCTPEDIKSTLKAYKDGRKEFLTRMESIEELLTIFRGPHYGQFFDSFDVDNECRKNFPDKNFFDATENRAKLDEVETLLGELDNYMKRQLWWAANTICSVCNPFNHPFVDLQANTIQGQESTCREMLEDKDFEMRLAHTYEHFIKHVVELINCKNKKTDAAPAIDYAEVQRIRSEFDYCFQVNNMMEAKCNQLCQRPIGVYSFHIKFFKSAKEALAIIYEHFSDGEHIEDFYDEVKERPFKNESDENAIAFYAPVASGPSYAQLKWIFDNVRGITVMTDYMHKRYYGASAAALAVSLLTMLVALF